MVEGAIEDMTAATTGADEAFIAMLEIRWRVVIVRAPHRSVGPAPGDVRPGVRGPSLP
jgi:hypothetical protein